jgi:hypothetical protein
MAASAGGLALGAAINHQPGLFGAALLQVRGRGGGRWAALGQRVGGGGHAALLQVCVVHTCQGPWAVASALVSRLSGRLP